MSPQSHTVTPAEACIELADVFHDPMLEDGLAPRNASQQRIWNSLQQRAQAACLGCPIQRQCLYEAVVVHDVAGYCAGTTERQRRRIRRLLDWQVTPENLDDLAGVSGANRQINPSTVARLRAANPDESLEALAERLGCSLSTVKRHLHRMRAAAAAPRRVVDRPTMEQVLAARAQVCGAVLQAVAA